MIFTDDSHLIIAGKVISALIKSIDITSEAKIDEEQIEGATSSVRQAVGYEDAKINIELWLMDSANVTASQKLKTITDIFKPADQEKPVPLDIENEHCSIRGIRQVLFKKLQSKENNNDNSITASIELWQVKTATVEVVKTDSETTTKVTTNKAAVKKATAKKTVSHKVQKSPAKDNTKTGKYSNSILKAKGDSI